MKLVLELLDFVTLYRETTLICSATPGIPRHDSAIGLHSKEKTMASFVRRTIVASCLLLVAGCVTDELAVYKKSVVSREAVKAFEGVYQVEEWPGNVKPESVGVTEKDGELNFAYWRTQ